MFGRRRISAKKALRQIAEIMFSERDFGVASELILRRLYGAGYVDVVREDFGLGKGYSDVYMPTCKARFWKWEKS